MQSAVNVNDVALQPKRRPGCGALLVRFGVGVIAVIGVLLLAGFTFEALMQVGDAERFPPPGQRYSVDGHSMHLNCVGEGDVAVILEAGANAYSDTWAVAQPQLAALTRTCSYDRAGYGWSEAGSADATPEQAARSLHALLTAADVQPPYILVAHSSGGKIARLFTGLYPETVGGLVFLDARHESMEPTDRTPEENLADREAFESSLNLHRTLRRFGVVRLFGLQLGRSLSPSLNAYPDDTAYRSVMFGVRETTLQTMIAESRESTANDDQLRAMTLPAGLPVYVLTAGDSLDMDGWEAAQAQLAALSTNSEWQIVPDASHELHAEHPDRVLEAVQWVLTARQ